METSLLDYKGGQIMLLKDDDSTVCVGDSGGPSFLKVRDQLVLLGVHSGGTAVDCKLKKRSFLDQLLKKNDLSSLGVDVFVPLVRDWVRTNQAKLQSQKDI
jgi:hypothetical protein